MKLTKYGKLLFMRDLGGQNFGNFQRSSKAKTIFRILILLIIVGGVFYFAKSRLSLGQIGTGAVILKEAPRGLKPVVIDQTADLTEGGVQLSTQQATFEDVRYNGQAKATASRSFGGGLYILSVDATLPDPNNTYYEVWLVSDGKVIPIDFMTGSKTSWSLRLRSSDKYSSYDGIWNTLERTKDELPEEHILEGSF